MRMNNIKVVLLLLVLSISMPSQAGVLSKKRNVLFIAVDDLKPIGGLYGDKTIYTPHLDKLAQTGFVFDNNHCQQAVCAPTRASILTGKRPDYTQIWDLKTFIRDKQPDIVTLPQYFHSKGYQTAAIGKVFDKRSVDEKHDSLSWSIPYLEAEGSSVVGGGYMKETRRVSTECADVADSTTMDGRMALDGIELMRQLASDDEPFFLAVGFHKPHLPFAAPKKYWDLYDRSKIKTALFTEKAEGSPDYAYQPGWEVRSQYEDVPKDFDVPISIEKQKELIHGYYACVSFIDQQIGLVIDELDKLGIRENTLIVLWGDHGWHLGDHNMWCKHTNFEQATRSPLVIALDDKYVGTTNAPTEFVDVFPTICDLANVKTPNYIDGLSLEPIMNGDRTEVKPMAVSQFTRWPDRMGYTFRDTRYRYTVWMSEHFRSGQVYDASLIDDEELYDYQKDPLETKNLIGDAVYSEVRKSMVEKSKVFFNEAVEKKK